MIIPSGWAMPFLSSLTHTGTPVGGQQQRDTQMLEAGVPRFPHDFPTTGPYHEHAEVWEASERGQWERTPPSKRVNYQRLGINNPWKADWETVLGGCTPAVTGHVSTQRDLVHSWLLSQSLAPSVLNGILKVSNPTQWLYDKVRISRSGRGREASADDLWYGALVQVQVELHGKGTLSDIAAVYPLRSDEVQICNSSFKGLQVSLPPPGLPRGFLKTFVVP